MRKRKVWPASQTVTGAGVVCSALEGVGVKHVFALAGSQSLELHEALRRSALVTIRPTHELAAAFMATGYARASGRPGVMLAIPGPGLAYAFAGLVEARAGSVPLVCIVPTQPKRDAPNLPSEIVHDAIAGAAVAKELVQASGFGQLKAAVLRSFDVATSGEPGPVLLEVSAAALEARGVSQEDGQPRPAAPPIAEASVEELAGILAASRRVVLVVGAEVVARPGDVRMLAEALRSPVLATTSARGVLPENHPLSLGCDPGLALLGDADAFFEGADLVLALGCRGFANGTGGFKPRIGPGKLVHVAASAEASAAGPTARLTLRVDAATLLSALLAHRHHFAGRPTGWTVEALARIRSDWLSRLEPHGPQPLVIGGPPARFFAELRGVLPEDVSLVTDSGLHQMMVRRHFPVLCPRGLITPCGYQVMGFGIPAAVGASLAVPRRPVVAAVGDGGLLMSAMEVLTAVELGLSLKILVFCDGRLGLIHRQQMGGHGHAHGTELPSLDLALLARSLGAGHVRLAEGKAEDGLRAAMADPGVTLVEVPVGDSGWARVVRVRAMARNAVGNTRAGSLLRSLASRVRGRRDA